MRWRHALTALSLAASGLELGRGLVRDAIDQRAADATAAAIAEARARIAEEARRAARQILRRFILSTLIKAAIALSLWAATLLGWISSDGFAIGLGVLVAVFFVRDIVISWPALRLITRELRASGGRPIRAFADYAARRTEAEALKRAETVELGWTARAALMLAGRDKATLSSEIAASTAAAVRDTTWRDVRPMAYAAAAKMIVGSALYSALLLALSATIG